MLGRAAIKHIANLGNCVQLWMPGVEVPSGPVVEQGTEKMG